MIRTWLDPDGESFQSAYEGGPDRVRRSVYGIFVSFKHFIQIYCAIFATHKLLQLFVFKVTPNSF